MFHNSEMIWLGVAGVGLLCIVVIYVAVRSP